MHEKATNRSRPHAAQRNRANPPASQPHYLVDGIYRARGGWNLAVIVATAAGYALAWGGLVVPALKPLYDYAWFVGFFVAGLSYWSLAAVKVR